MEIQGYTTISEFVTNKSVSPQEADFLNRFMMDTKDLSGEYIVDFVRNENSNDLFRYLYTNHLVRQEIQNWPEGAVDSYDAARHAGDVDTRNSHLDELVKVCRESYFPQPTEEFTTYVQDYNLAERRIGMLENYNDTNISKITNFIRNNLEAFSSKLNALNSFREGDLVGNKIEMIEMIISSDIEGFNTEDLYFIPEIANAVREAGKRNPKKDVIDKGVKWIGKYIDAQEVLMKTNFGENLQPENYEEFMYAQYIMDSINLNKIVSNPVFELNLDTINIQERIKNYRKLKKRESFMNVVSREVESFSNYVNIETAKKAWSIIKRDTSKLIGNLKGTPKQRESSVISTNLAVGD